MKTFTTSKGFKFTRTETGWLDEASGLEWDIEFRTDISQYDAESWAKEKDKSLPTQAQFIEAEDHGIRELPEIEWKGYWFWSKTSYRNYADDAYGFYGGNGLASTLYYRNYSYYYIAAHYISGVSVASESNEVERLKKAKALITEAMELMEGIWE